MAYGYVLDGIHVQLLKLGKEDSKNDQSWGRRARKTCHALSKVNSVTPNLR